MSRFRTPSIMASTTSMSRRPMAMPNCALRRGCRRFGASIFLGCKTTERTRDGAKRSIHASLERLGVDAFDLFQLHSVGTMEKLDQCLGKGGAIEAVLEARDEGLLKYIGITGHGLDAPKVHAEGLRRFPLDTVMFPLNFVLYTNLPDYRRDYEALIAVCQQRMSVSTSSRRWRNRRGTTGSTRRPSHGTSRSTIRRRLTAPSPSTPGSRFTRCVRPPT